MTPLWINLSFMLLLLLTTTITAQAAVYMYNFCENSTLSTSYKSNLNKVLSWITSDSGSATIKGFNKTIGHDNDNDAAAYGFYNCRMDVTGYFCQFCLTAAADEIARRCPNSITAIILYDICVIRYSNQSFYGKVSLSPTWNITGTRIIKDYTEVEKAKVSMESVIRKAVIETKQYWAVKEFDWGENEKRYGWVQCDRGLTIDDCGRCLHAMLDTFPECCGNGTTVQWAVFGPSCAVRFDDEKFYQNLGNIFNCVDFFVIALLAS